MSEHVTLYSSHPITFEELREAIVASGGEPVVPERASGIRDLLGRIEDEVRYIYIYGDAKPGDPGRFWDTEVYYLGKEVMEEIATKLGAKPVVSFMLKIGYTAKSGLLAMRLAQQCARRWPCVVRAEVFEDGEWKINIYTQEDMEPLLREGKAFTTYGMLDEDEEDDKG